MSILKNIYWDFTVKLAILKQIITIIVASQGTIIAKENWEFNKMVRDDLRFPFFLYTGPANNSHSGHICLCLFRQKRR